MKSITEVYHDALKTNKELDNEIAIESAKKSKESTEILYKELWLNSHETKAFIAGLQAIIEKISTNLSGLAANTEVSNLEVRCRLAEIETIRKTIEYARTDKYE